MTMFWNDKVIWSEGMFLQQQHFQQHDRYVERLLEGRTAPLLGYSWGFSRLELDAAALLLGKVQLSAARGIFPDGTPFDIPHQDASPTPLEIDTDAHDELVMLALPIRRVGADEADLAGYEDDSLSRFSVNDMEVIDSNAQSGNSAIVHVGRLRLRLMRKRDITDAYTTLGVVQVTERRADNQLILQKGYIPPMLHTGSDATLEGYIRELSGLLHQRGETLASRLSQPGRGGVAEVADFLLLQTVNRYEPVFAHFAAHPLLHPDRLFTLCLELAGDLATFSHGGRRPPAYPEYRQDALEQCFTPLIADLRRSLSMVLEQNAASIELQDRGHGVRVAIISDMELLKTASFVLAANAQLPSETLRRGFLSLVKIGTVERIRDLVNLQLPGIPFNSLPVAPRQIPFHAGFSYFEIERGGELWKQLERSGGLAMHIPDKFPNLELEFWAIRG